MRQILNRQQRNVSWNAVAGIGAIVVNVVLFPVAYSEAGAQSYGVWLICSAAVILFIQADLGLGSALLREVSQLVDTDVPRAHALERAGLSIFVLLAAIFPALFVFGTLAYFYFLTDVLSPGYLWLCIGLAAANLSIGLLGRFYTVCIQARNRFDVERKTVVLGFVARILGTVVVVSIDGGALGIVLVEGLSLVISPTLVTAIALRKFGMSLIPVWRSPHAKRFRNSLLNSSRAPFVAGLSMLGVIQAPLYFIGSVVGLSDAAVFAAGMRIYQSSRAVTGWLTGPALPTLSSALGAGDGRAARRTFLHLVIGTGVLGLAIGVPLSVASSEILSTWLGLNDPELSASFAIIGVAVVLTALYAPGVVAALALRRDRLLAWPNMLWLSVSLMIMVPLAGRWGAAGAAAAVLAPLVVLMPLQLIRVSQLLGVRFAAVAATVAGLTASGFASGVLIHTALPAMNELSRLAITGLGTITVITAAAAGLRQILRADSMESVALT
jgi:O-antigen/teichoic acid export membrane protein